MAFGALPLARHPGRSCWHCHTTIKLLWLQSQQKKNISNTSTNSIRMSSLGPHIQEQYIVHKLRVLQNREARTFTGADRYTRITRLHEMFNFDATKTKIKHLARKTKETYTSHDNTLILHIGQSQHNTRLHYKKPTQISD